MWKDLSVNGVVAEKDLGELLVLGTQSPLLGDLTLLAGLLGQNLPSAKSLGVGVETDKNTSVAERVLALGEGTLDDGLASGTDNGLDFVGVDETGKVGVGDDGLRESVVLFQGGGSVNGTVKSVQLLERGLGPDDKSTEVTTGCKLKKVEAGDVGQLNTRDVAESLNDTLVLTIDDERTPPLPVTTVAELANTSTELLAVGNLFNVGESLNRLQERNSGLSLSEGLDTVADDEGDLLDLLDSVTTGKNQRGR